MPSSALLRSALGLVGSIALCAALFPGTSPEAGSKVTVGHGMSMHGDLKYGPGFKHFQYASPEAAKGGEVKLATVGTFDTLNPFVLKGVAAIGLGDMYDSLMVSSRDEAFSKYGQPYLEELFSTHYFSPALAANAKGPRAKAAAENLPPAGQ